MPIQRDFFHQGHSFKKVKFPKNWSTLNSNKGTSFDMRFEIDNFNKATFDYTNHPNFW